MFKRLMIGLFALSLAAIWVSEADALKKRRRRSVGVEVASDNPAPTDENEPFVAGVFGLPGDEYFQCGEVRGELYCAQSTDPEDILECQKASGDSAARVLVLDKDAIKAGVPPNFFSKWEVNFDIKDRGQREQLRGFEARALSPEPAVIFLPTGKKSNAGFHAITGLTLSKWNEGGDLTDDEALRRFVGTWNATAGKFIPDDGFGINGEKFIHKVPGIVPLFGSDLDDLVGETICAAVKHPQVKGNPLKGKYLGLVAFKARSRSGSLLEVEVLDADFVCGQTLYIETLTDGAATAEVSGDCLVVDAETANKEAVVFAPAFPDIVEGGGLRAGEGKFIAAEGTLSDCTGPHCKGSVEVVLDPDVGQQLCADNFGPGVKFVNFIPINRGEGVYADWAFTSIIESPVEGLSDEVICGEEIESDIKFSQYGCVPLDEVEIDGVEEVEIPTCFSACGQKFPGFLTANGNYEDFLDAVGVDAENCIAVEMKDFTNEVWDFKPVGTEAGHKIFTIRDAGEVTILFDSDDCSSMGIARRVDFREENLVFEDTEKDGAEISLNPYSESTDPPFPKPGKGESGEVQIDIYMCKYFPPPNAFPVVLDYLEDPFAVKKGQYFFFFNDYHPSADYDDFVLIGEQVKEVVGP